MPWEEASIEEFSSSVLTVGEPFELEPALQAEKRQARVNTTQAEIVVKEFFEITRGA